MLLHGFPEFWWAWRRQIAPFATAGYHVVVPDLRGYNASEAPLRAMVAASPKPGSFEPGALDRYVAAWSLPGRLTAMLNYYRALRQREPGAEPARMLPPTLILWAGDDGFLERHVAEAGLALCDDGRLVVIDGASHWLHVEQPERVNAKVLGFLTGAHGA